VPTSFRTSALEFLTRRYTQPQLGRLQLSIVSAAAPSCGKRQIPIDRTDGHLSDRYIDPQCTAYYQGTIKLKMPD